MNCQNCLEFIDKYLEGELSRKQRMQMADHLKKCDHCRKAVEVYEKMTTDIRDIEPRECPNEIVDSVYELLNLNQPKPERVSILERLREFLNAHQRQMRLAVAGAVIVFFALLIHLRVSHQPRINQKYSAEEIDQAKDQVKLALAYFNHVTTKTEEILEKQVLPKDVVQPMKSSIKTAMKPLINGG